MAKQDLHEEIRVWMKNQGFPALSLDEVPLSWFNSDQMKIRNNFLERFVE